MWWQQLELFSWESSK